MHNFAESKREYCTIQNTLEQTSISVLILQLKIPRRQQIIYENKFHVLQIPWHFQILLWVNLMKEKYFSQKLPDLQFFFKIYDFSLINNSPRVFPDFQVFLDLRPGYLFLKVTKYLNYQKLVSRENLDGWLMIRSRPV